ncbi:hypothetical protein NQ318_008998 [Aromia moschata]|uniref:DDE-1 domain-containing protein n=1 Tax=Aromia moschata TaxID=1265417 RepID=A0AAV8XCM7_9CUCU|nr:hypothetical protein NQ318_008998 [Aromia moschata]
MAYLRCYSDNAKVATATPTPAPTRISNVLDYDETNCVDEPGAVSVVLKKGTKHAHKAIRSSKTSNAVMFATSGDSKLLLSYIVYKAKHLYEGWTEGGIEGTKYNQTHSGWFDFTIFEDWFNSVALPYFKKLGHKVLIGNNSYSHITESVIAKCEENDIRCVCCVLQTRLT